MDFDAAMQAHANWKVKLTAYAGGISSEKLDAVATAKDNACALGQWLHGDGKAVMAGRAEYRELVTAHADFHRQAATLVTLIDRGQAAQANAQLGDTKSTYREASSKVIGILMKLKRSASAPQVPRIPPPRVLAPR